MHDVRPQGLHVHRAGACHLSGFGVSGQQAAPVEPGGNVEAEERERRRQQIDRRHHAIRDHDRRVVATYRDDERHVHGRLVDEVRVRALAVLAEALAVVGGDDDHGAAERLGVEAVDESSEVLVDEGDLTVVAGAWGRGIVGVVRIEVVHPRKPGRVRRLGGEPAARRVGDRVGRPLDRSAADVAAELVVVPVEPLREPARALEHAGGHERSGGISGPGQDLRQGDRLVAEPMNAI